MRPTASAPSMPSPAAGATVPPWPRSCSRTRTCCCSMSRPTSLTSPASNGWRTGSSHFQGAAIIVSHDRKFLDSVVTRIIEVENFHLHEYPGNFAEYVVAKQFRLKTLESQFVHESELLAFEAEGISDRREAAKAASKGLDNKLSKIKKSRAPRPVDKIITEIYGGLHVKDMLCRVEGLAKSYGEKTLFTDLSFEIRRGNRTGGPGCQRQRQVHAAARADRARRSRIPATSPGPRAPRWSPTTRSLTSWTPTTPSPTRSTPCPKAWPSPPPRSRSTGSWPCSSSPRPT